MTVWGKRHLRLEMINYMVLIFCIRLLYRPIVRCVYLRIINTMGCYIFIYMIFSTNQEAYYGVRRAFTQNSAVSWFFPSIYFINSIIFGLRRFLDQIDYRKNRGLNLSSWVDYFLF